MITDCDVIVVGGGHAGCEAAAAAARLGAATVLLTQDISKIGEMSCNPAIGGIGKGHLVREIDALDGIMAAAADRAGIHFKLLNSSKGPAVHGPRAQCDRRRYRQAVRALLDELPNLELMSGTAAALVIEAGCVVGLRCEDGRSLGSRAVVIATGTFLRGVIHIGHETTPAGRVGDAPSTGLAEQLATLGLRMGRLKTGTPPRIARDSIAWESLPEDRGDERPQLFSRLSHGTVLPQISCRVTTTTERTHEIIRSNLARSALYGGGITGRGPRYCPSIEDKIVRFAHRSAHQVFLEPEGLPDGPDGSVVYPNGISTSLPVDAQQALLSTMPGLERARIVRPGYAIEYDYVDPRELDASLALRCLRGLFLAGQINGTTGYEEAGGQGLIAGLNAARHSAGGRPFTLRRDQAYIGVLIDDLVTSGVSEPYRMFTSRAEYRLTLRPDNADLRLTPLGVEIGCVRPERGRTFRSERDQIESATERAREQMVVREGVRRSALSCLAAEEWDVEGRPELAWVGELTERVRCHLLAEERYGGYLERQAREISALRQENTVRFPRDIDYRMIGGLSNEMRERLEAVRPNDFAQAQRIPGLSPPALLAVLAHVRALERRIA